MSTFKVPPTYAEVLFNFMDASDTEKMPLDIIRKCQWTFPGGAFGVREGLCDPPAHEELPTSMTEIPGGDIATWDEEMVARRQTGSMGIDMYPEPMAEILRNRRNRRAMSEEETAMWRETFAAVAHNQERIEMGMRAVYFLVTNILDDTRDSNDEAMRREARLHELTMTLIEAGTCSSDLHMPTTRANAVLFLMHIKSAHVPAMNKAIKDLTLALRRVESEWFINEAYDVADQIEANKPVDDVRYDPYDISWPAYEFGKEEWFVHPKVLTYVDRDMGTSWVLGISDIRKCIQLLTGIRNYSVAFAAESSIGTSDKMAEAAIAHSIFLVMIRDICWLGQSVKHTDMLNYHKLIKQVLSIYKAGLAGDLSAGFRDQLLADAKASPLFDILGERFDHWLNRISALTPRMGLAVAKVFRMLPPPDVWLLRALRDRWEKASVIRCPDDPKLDDLETALREVILTARMHDKGVRLELRDPTRPPGWWRDYVRGEIDRVPTADLANHVRIHNTINMVERSRYDPTVWKDSGLGMDTFEEAMADEINPIKTNFLTRMVFDRTCPMPDDRLPPKQEISNTMLKPETHKERVAYSNNAKSRMNQSACEATVGNTMRSHPSFAIEKSGVDRDQIFDMLSQPAPSAIAVPMPDEFQGSYWVDMCYSFDITEWSATMEEGVQTRSHRVWDDFTGDVKFIATRENRYRATVYMNQGGAKAWYTNGGANFEGYNGKEMTALHIAIMSIAVRELRARFPHVPARMIAIMLQGYIDDGIAKLRMPSAIATEVFAVWCEVVVEVWARYGFTIERKKSFPSTRYFEFLGEEYFQGRHMATGTKAAMRITADPFEAHESLVDRIAKICASCRGSAVAGLSPLCAYMMQSYFVSSEVATWVDIRDPVAVSCWLVAPRALGGVGMTALFQEATNACGAATEEAFANLHAWARYNDGAKRAYCAMFRRGMGDRTPVSILMTPLGGESEYGVMSGSATAVAVRKALENQLALGRLSELAANLVAMGNSKATEEFANVVVQMAPDIVYQEAMLIDTAEPLPARIHQTFVSRFEKAKTLSRIAGRGVIRRLVRKNRDAAVMSYEHMRLLISPAGMGQSDSFLAAAFRALRF